MTPEKRARTDESEEMMVSRTPGLTTLNRELDKEDLNMTMIPPPQLKATLTQPIQ